MNLTYAEIIRTAMTAVRDSTTLQQWCMENYGKVPAIYNDLSPMESPVESDCPVVAFAPIGGENGQDEAPFSRGFMVRVALSDDEVDEETDETGRVIWRLYKGTERVSYLLEMLVYPALCEAFNFKNVPISTEDEQIETSNLTLFEAKAGLVIQMEKTIGEDRPYLG